MPIPHRHRSGFTLIEMVITILVMGILTAVAAPKYIHAISSRRVDMAARRIVADLHYARSESQRVSGSRTVEFSVANNNYSLLQVSALNDLTRNYIVELVEAPFSAVLVSATFGNDSIGFDSVVIFDIFGRPDSTGEVIIQSGGIQRTISLAADGTATKL